MLPACFLLVAVMLFSLGPWSLSSGAGGLVVSLEATLAAHRFHLLLVVRRGS